MMILDRIDATLDNRCPCGADPRPDSAYCSYDCEPTHVAADTDPRSEGAYATPMRWRPDLVNANDDTNLTPVTAFGDPHGDYTGRYNAQVFRYTDRPGTWHLRLDNGHRYVGLNITEDEVYNAPNLTVLLSDMWARLERELDNTRHLEAEGPQWWRFYDHPTLDTAAGNHQHPPSFHNPPWRPIVNRREAAILTAAGLQEHQHFEVYPDRINFDNEEFREAAAAAINAASAQHQRLMEQIAEPLARLADTLTQTADQLTAAGYIPEQPPADPMERALWLRRNRNTGPTAPRLDGRRRRHR